jgi:hypothetical protein
MILSVFIPNLVFENEFWGMGSEIPFCFFLQAERICWDCTSFSTFL